MSEMIDSNGIELAIHRVGSGFPTIMVHGNRDKKETLLPLATRMAEQIGGEYILIDLRGHGESEKATNGYDINHFVADILGVCQSLGLESFNYIGHSLGSTVGIQLASKYTNMVNKLVLMSAAAIFEIGFKRPHFSRENFREQLNETNKRASNFFFSNNYPQVAEEIMNNWLNIDYDVHMQMIQLKHPDLRGYAKEILAPTLIFAGSEDKSTTVNDARVLSSLIPNSAVEIITGSHYMFLEQIHETAEIIERFLV